MNVARVFGSFVAAIALGTSSLAANDAKVEGAKDLFYRQMSNPAVQMNTGVQYWIELKRNGQVSKVSNKFDFRSGDRIKFHVKSNINGYAYVILKEGSEGDHAVLFPDAKLRDDNRVKAGADYALPGDGYLVFDAHPGNEKVMLLLSRGPLQADEYLKSNKPRVLVASREPGAKDLIPGSAVVAFEDNNQITDLQIDEAPAQAAHLPTEKPQSSVPASTASNTTSGASTVANSAPHNQASGPSVGNFVTTVVEKNPQIILALDIVLTHKP